MEEIWSLQRCSNNNNKRVQVCCVRSRELRVRMPRFVSVNPVTQPDGTDGRCGGGWGEGGDGKVSWVGWKETREREIEGGMERKRQKDGRKGGMEGMEGKLIDKMEWRNGKECLTKKDNGVEGRSKKDMEGKVRWKRGHRQSIDRYIISRRRSAAILRQLF